MLLAQRGAPPAVLVRCPAFLPQAERIFEAYWDIDRSEWGTPLFSGMRQVLDEFGWTEPSQRRLVRALWRSMAADEAQAREERRKAAEAISKRPGPDAGDD